MDSLDIAPATTERKMNDNRTPTTELTEWAKPVDLSKYFPHIQEEREDARAEDFAFLLQCGIRPDEDILG